ncbi:MAG: hypothetical protein KGH69_04130 [Candidatus Micrarchaeota archaeon]|nr:hypothetical protein [Candidatus Micrarchaeota archaeon]
MRIRGITELGRERMLLERQVLQVRRTVADNGRYLKKEDIEDFKSIMDGADALLKRRVLFGPLRRDRNERIGQMVASRASVWGIGMYLDFLLERRIEDEERGSAE